MSQLRKYPFAYLGAICGLLAIGFFFLPMVYASTVQGAPIYVYGFTIAFGGEILVESEGSVYSMSFSTNIFALILLMCLLLSVVAALLSKESAINRAAAIALAVAGVVLTFVLPHQIGQVGLHVGYGAFLCSGFSLLGAVCDTLAFFIRPRKA